MITGDWQVLSLKTYDGNFIIRIKAIYSRKAFIRDILFTVLFLFLSLMAAAIFDLDDDKLPNFSLIAFVLSASLVTLTGVRKRHKQSGELLLETSFRKMSIQKGLKGAKWSSLDMPDEGVVVLDKWTYYHRTTGRNSSTTIRENYRIHLIPERGHDGHWSRLRQQCAGALENRNVKAQMPDGALLFFEEQDRKKLYYIAEAMAKAFGYPMWDFTEKTPESRLPKALDASYADVLLKSGEKKHRVYVSDEPSPVFVFPLIKGGTVRLANWGRKISALFPLALYLFLVTRIFSGNTWSVLYEDIFSSWDNFLIFFKDLFSGHLPSDLPLSRLLFLSAVALFTLWLLFRFLSVPILRISYSGISYTPYFLLLIPSGRRQKILWSELEKVQIMYKKELHLISNEMDIVIKTFNAKCPPWIKNRIDEWLAEYGRK